MEIKMSALSLLIPELKDLDSVCSQMGFPVLHKSRVPQAVSLPPRAKSFAVAGNRREGMRPAGYFSNSPLWWATFLWRKQHSGKLPEEQFLYMESCDQR